MTSIRRQLTVSLVGGLILILVLCGAVLYLYVRHALIDQFDDSLLNEARAFAAMSEHEEEERESPEGDGEFEFEFSEAALPEFQPSPNAAYYQVWDEDGGIVAKSPSLEDASLTLFRALANEAAIRNIGLPDGRPGRALAFRFAPRREGPSEHASAVNHEALSKEPLVLILAHSREELNRTLHILLSGLCVTGILLLTSTGLLVRLVIQRELRPLEAVADQASTIDVGNLTHRFPTQPIPQEILPICLRLNELLERLERAFTREQRFTSDVAHELRTPIAELRTLAEVGLRTIPRLNDKEELSPYFDDTLSIATQMERLVDVLLTLARCESGQQAMALEYVDLSVLVKEAWRPFQNKARELRLSVGFQLPAEAFLETDPALLRSLVTNLFSNATAYTPEAGTLQIDLVHEGDALALTISNTNDQLEAQDVPHLFAPFWRKDKARSDSAHSGVGLSVAAALARLLGMDLSANLPRPDWFQIRMSHSRSGGIDTAAQ
jgi:signal transduction histidine kinase